MNNKLKIILIILLIIILMFVFRTLKLSSITSLYSEKYKVINGIENYDKNYYITEYKGDLDSNLSIFPDDVSNMIDSKFISSFSTNLFDSDGYILLSGKYSNDEFNKEIERIKSINIIIKKTCYQNSETYTNYIRYDETSYYLPAYVSIDGFANTYEYALINEKDLEITYVYLSYPNLGNDEYNKYLKKDKSEYSKGNTLSKFSIYNHTFDNGKSYSEFDDC